MIKKFYKLLKLFEIIMEKDMYESDQIHNVDLKSEEVPEKTQKEGDSIINEKQGTI